MKKILTSESVNIGHSDKTCDTIADAFLDEALRQDKNAQMAVECAIKDDLLMIYGEATTTAQIDYCGIAQEILQDIGYTKPFRILQQISRQSPDIHQAVVQEGLRANDQGMVYGYACNETPELMPLPIVIAHRLMQRYEEFRKGTTGFFADAKSQVSVEYRDDKPMILSTVLVSASHADNLSQEQVQTIITEQVINPVIDEFQYLVTSGVQIIVNPSGKFTIWGSYSDSGCVGRKIVVDTYGGVGRVGGGCFSSKNATKVDRSGAYYARFVAKNIVAKGYADRCEIGVAYGIGLAEPLSLYIETFGTHKKPLAQIEKFVSKNFDFRPSNIIRELDLLKPIYKQTACYGHFGRSDFAWERIKETK
jgi:S-adenosylmethionine synthetase